MTYKHILVPTDGTARSRRAIKLAVELAARLDARVTSLYVVPEGVPTLFSGDKLYGSGVLSAQTRTADCDLIVMATHGRRGLAALGSQTMKTVTHSRVPVLVCR